MPRRPSPSPLAAGILSTASLLTSLAPAQGNASADYFEGIGLLRRELHEEAAAKLRRFVQRAPEDARVPEAWYRIGTCELALRRRDAAIDAFSRSLASTDQPFEVRAECRYRLGNALRAAERWEPAAQQYARLLQEVADDHYLAVPARYAMAESLRDAGRLEPAVEQFLEVAKRDASDQGTHAAPALYHAGYSLIELGRPQPAAAAFQRVVERYRDHSAAAESRWMVGEALFQAEAYEPAEKAFEAAASAGGEFADDGRSGVAWCRIERGDAVGAIQQFRRLVRDHADSELVPGARVETGRLLLRTGDAGAAIAELSGVLPTLRGADAAELRIDALELLGLARLETGQAEAAGQAFDRALQDLNSLGAADAQNERTAVWNARLRHGRGDSFADRNQWQAALADYEAAVELLGADGLEREASLAGDALYGCALAQHKLGQFEASTAAATRVLDLPGPHRLAAHAEFAIGENEFSTKDWGAADGRFAKVPADHELARRAAFKRAWCAYLQDDRKSAAMRFQALIGDVAPGDRDAIARESLSMVALASLGIPDADRALAAADRYRAEHPRGEFLARTERVAAQVLTARGELRAAAARLRKAAEASDDPAQAAEDELQRAELAFRDDDFDGARSVYDTLIGRDDAIGARALEGSAWCAFELGDLDVARARIQRGLEHPAGAAQRAGLLELRIALDHREERWTDAIATATAFLTEFPEHESSLEVRYGLGVAQSRAGELAAARETLGALGSVETYAKRARVFYEAGWAARRAKDEQAALAAFAKVVEFGGKSDADLIGEARLHLGVAALEADRRDAALQQFAAVTGKYRPQALYRAGFSLLEDEPTRAKEPLLELVGLGPDQPLYYEALFLVGEAESAEGNHRGAVGRYRELLRKAPDHERVALAQLHLGRSAVETEQYDVAISALSEFLAAPEPDQPNENEPSETREVEAAQRAKALLWRGRAHAGRKDHERAEADFADVLQRTESVLAAEAQFRIGASRRARGEVAAAAEAFVKLPIFYADGEWVRRGLYEAGSCYRELDQPSKAAKLWRELIERFPKSAEAAAAKKAMAATGDAGKRAAGGEGGK